MIDKKKEYATSHQRSFYRIIESCLKALIEKDKPQADDDLEISHFVTSMRSGVKLPADIDYKKSYGDYLAERYK